MVKSSEFLVSNVHIVIDDLEELSLKEVDLLQLDPSHETDVVVGVEII